MNLKLNETLARDLALWFAILALLQWGGRALLMWSMSDTASTHEAYAWARGFASDAAMAALLAWLAVWLGTYHRLVPAAITAILCLALAGNREYVGEWQSNLSFLDIEGLIHPEFIKGSVLTPRFLFTFAVFVLAVLAMYRYLRRAAYLPTLREVAGITIAAFLVFLIPATPPQLWLEQSLLEENINQIYQWTLAEEEDLSPIAIAAAERFTDLSRRQDLSGTSFVAKKPNANVMIITIESMTQTELDLGWMPYLKELADNHLHYTQYLNPNITTIRGLYAMFCGEETFWGRYGRDRMPVHIEEASVYCLPMALSAANYHTAYMQGADLSFQGKRAVMRAMQFGEVLGNQELPEGDRFSEWGLDDNSLFAQAKRKIETYEKQGDKKSWMIGLMTVGTHHPYNVDPSFEPQLPLRERAYRYTDDAIRQLIEWLKASGRIDNTLVIITGDESRDLNRNFKGIGATIARNRGILVVVTPGKEKRVVTAPFLQSDLELSILDFVGASAPAYVGGRSIFREYEAFRPIAFADYAQQSVYAFWRARELTHCRTSSWTCTLYELSQPALFDSGQSFSPQKTDPGPTRALFEDNRRYWIRKH